MAHGSSIALEMAARPDSLEQAQIQAARDASVCQSKEEQASSSNDNACDDVTMPLSGRPDNLEVAQMQAAAAASSSSWTAYRTTTVEATGDEDDTQTTQGPAPQEWIDQGWIDYSENRRKPYPGETWYGWCNYSPQEWEAWMEQTMVKVIRMAERDDDEEVSQPYAKKVRAPSSPVQVLPSEIMDDMCDVFIRMDI